MGSAVRRTIKEFRARKNRQTEIDFDCDVEQLVSARHSVSFHIECFRKDSHADKNAIDLYLSRDWLASEHFDLENEIESFDIRAIIQLDKLSILVGY